jgi:thiamine biosynthesis lipoprotein
MSGFAWHALMARLLLGLLLSILAAHASAEWLSDEQAIMGTAVRVELWHEDTAEGRAAIAAVMDEMRRIDNLMSPYKPDSELSRINREAAKHPVRISREQFDLIARAIEFSRLSGGVFDITFASVGYMYDYRRGVEPSDEQIEQALPGIDYRHLLLDREQSTIRFGREGVRIDLGGIAKGYAVDIGIAVLKKRGIASAIVQAGGDSRVLGDKRGRPWNVAIRDPRNKQNVVAVIPLVNAAISTSGDYERFFMKKSGERVHHIIDPKTGKSAHGVISVSVIAPDATTTDGLTKSVFLKGPKEGIAFIEGLKMPGVEAVIIDEQGKMHFSKGLQQAPSK